MPILMAETLKFLAVLLGCLFFLRQLECVLSTDLCAGRTCQNGGKCVQQESTTKCICPCNYTGEHCEFRSWCSKATFEKTGCFASTNNREELFNMQGSHGSTSDSEWNWYLENVTCTCALTAKEKGFKYFSVGGSSVCAGYREMNFSLNDRKSSGCQGKAPNRDQCNDTNALIACIGSVNHEYVYKLSEVDQLHCATSKFRDCSDYDYIVRFTTNSTTRNQFDGITDGLPAGKSFSFCLWHKMIYVPDQKFYPMVSYATTTYYNHFISGISTTSVDAPQLFFAVKDQDTYFGSFTSSNPFGRWVHFCTTLNFDLSSDQAIVYIDGMELVRTGRSAWTSLDPGGILVIGRDQDSYGGGFNVNDASIGDFTLLNVWDFVLGHEDIRYIYNGVGTETGNFLAWADLKMFLNGPIDITGSPLMKWEGKGCQWENMKCDDFGSCQGGIFRCPCNNSALAPRSCVSSKIHRTEPCSGHDYVLEFPSDGSPSDLLIHNVIHLTSKISSCVWLKIPPTCPSGTRTVISFLTSGAKYHFRLEKDRHSYGAYINRYTVTWYDSTTYANDQWRHICQVVNQEKVTAYKNGGSMGMELTRNPWIPGEVRVSIGYRSDWHSAFFPGSMAHLNIWDFVLSESTIAALAEGAHAHGNFLSWPTIKQHVREPIKMLKSSPFLKWTGQHCTWSDDLCMENQMCEGAKLSCPAVEVNIVAPDSCADYSFIPISKMNKPKWKNEFVNAILVSRGMDESNHEGLHYSSIFVNNIEHKCLERGMHFLILNAMTGDIEKKYHCDTYGDTSCDTTITRFLDDLRLELIVLMVVWDSSEHHVPYPALRSIVDNRSFIPRQLGHREGMALIGYKSNEKTSWISSKFSARNSGPTIIRSTIPLIRESCMDHLYMGARENGKYVIYPPGGTEMTVYCDFTTNGGGWTVIQRRHEGRIPFSRNSEQYRDGFGDMDGEFWLGNEKIRRLGKGQFLAKLTSKENYSTYDSYNDFEVDSNFLLHARDHSGMIPNGVFGSNNSDGLNFQTGDSSGSCAHHSDGGWWFDDNCDSVNLNSKKEKCGHSFLTSEMMIRSRIPSRDMILKTTPNTISYKDAMTICSRDNMRLCTAKEVCRDGKTPYGGVKPGNHWVPLSDQYNTWMQIGTGIEPACSYFSDLSWGVTNDASDLKGHVFCCAIISKARAMVPRFTVPYTTSYQDAEKICRLRHRRLCSFIEICPDGAMNNRVPVGGMMNIWVPIADRYNDWVRIGNDLIPACSVHSVHYNTTPSWGETNTVHLQRGSLYCCPVVPIVRGILKPKVDNTMTYEDAMKTCRENNRRLCSTKEVCPNGHTPIGGVVTGHNWVPVVDAYNQWLSIGDNRSACLLHSYVWGFPSWGIDSNQARSWKVHLFCCNPVREGTINRVWKYELKFRGTGGHVRLPRITPLQTFSICWWMAMNAVFDDWRTLFSHWSLNLRKKLFEFSLNSTGSYQLNVGNDKRESKFPGVFLVIDEHHHHCITFNGESGSAKVYRDGSLVELFENFNKDVLLSDGTLIIGHTLMDNTQFDPKSSFEGVITRFNIWDRELDAGTVNEYSLVCGEEEGSIVAWPEVKLWISGKVEIEEGEACFPANCLDYVYRNKKEDGIYQIKPHKNDSSFYVYCDLKTAGGGWTVIGKRETGTIVFNDKNWNEYKVGFGDLDKEFWLGHEKIHQLTRARTEQMLVFGETDIKSRFVATYERFKIENEYKQYAIVSEEITANSPDNLGSMLAFHTKDKESPHNCAQNYGPYWHQNNQNCIKSNLFGDWNEESDKRAQWFGKTSPRLRYMSMKTRPTEEFKRSLPVRFFLSKTLTWSSAEAFCQRKGSYLCSSTDICTAESNYLFGGRLPIKVKVPIADGYGLFINIGEQQTCEEENLGSDGTESIYKAYKGPVFCCQGSPKRDWRFDLRFRSNGSVNIERMPWLKLYTVCWWMRVSPFEQEWATVFTFLTEQKQKLQFSYQGDGNVKIIAGSSERGKNIPSVIDGTWHHYCLRLDGEQNGGYFKFYFDGKDTGVSISLTSAGWLQVTVSWKMTIGQETDTEGNVVSGRGMIGELTRFNWWHKIFVDTEILEMSKQCGNEVGNILAWPQLKYWLVGNVEMLEGTTCVKPDKHLWLLNEANVVEKEYEDILNQYNATVIPDTAVKAGAAPLTLGKNEVYLRIDKLFSDCIADPTICSKTGLTVAMWLKRQGFVSNILPESDKKHGILQNWLDETAPGVSDWLPCYNSTGGDLDITAFHVGCDFKGPTVTLLKVDDYIFGGFSNENWGGPSRFIPSRSSFLFSLHNPYGTRPVKIDVNDEHNNTALYTSDTTGPVFGDNSDLKIGSYDSSGTCCSSILGQTYNVPLGYTRGTNEAKYFFTSKEKFSIDQLEVFYAYVLSEPVGIKDPNMIGNEQITASSFQQVSTSAPYFARLNSNNFWRSVANDQSPWLQVKLLDKTPVKKIAIQGCVDTWIEKFSLSFGMDGILWTTYEEKRTQKIFEANADGTSVKEIELPSPVDSRFVRINVVVKHGLYACMRIEIYSSESAVGMESEVIPDENILASSNRVDHLAPYHARQNPDYKGWAPGEIQFPQWLQIELNKEETLTHVAIQGNVDLSTYDFCKSYTLHYRKASGTFVAYEENGRQKIFNGYSDRSKTIKDMFLKPFPAQFVRLYPQLGSSVPTWVIRLELYKSLSGFGTTIISTGGEAPGSTGVSFSHQGASQYRFAVKTDRRTWELLLDLIPYQWTHFAFTWSENSGIQFYKNGNWKSKSTHSTVNSDFSSLFKSSPLNSLNIGKNYKQSDIIPQVLAMTDLSVVKRHSSPNEVKSLIYEVPCNFESESPCTWTTSDWSITKIPTPTNDTGPVGGLTTKENDGFAFLESSYPLRKGSRGLFTSRYVTQPYNCLHFYYHMHGTTMGRLNVFSSGANRNDTLLLWRLAGDQGDGWRQAVVALGRKYSEDLRKISFEGVVGDGYLSDIALDNISFTVDSQCRTTPPAARPTIKAIPKKRKCYCITKSESLSDPYLKLSQECNSSSSGFEWLSNGILKTEGKCLRPKDGPVEEGTPLVLSDSCDQNDVAFRLTSAGAIEHRSSELCIQPARWIVFHENEQLVLGEKGCDHIRWSVGQVFVKGAQDTGYSTQTALKIGLDDFWGCLEDDESLIPFIPSDLRTSHPGSRILALEQNTRKFLPATVLAVKKPNNSLDVLFDNSGSAIVRDTDTSLMTVQPLKGSEILSSIIPYTSLLSKWISSRGSLSEYWKPCVYSTRGEISNSTCAMDPSVPTLLVIRKNHVIIGGFANNTDMEEESTGNFLFSIKGTTPASALKFDDVSNASVILSEHRMAFGENSEELSLTWDDEAPAVVCRPGKFFQVSDVNWMVGHEEFDATDFEILQPHDEVCLPRCKSNEKCDQITGKCVCDHANRPPAWCLTGPANKTIYGDADHYWSMDSVFNIIDHKVKHISWGRVDGDIKENLGVNDRGIELENDDGKVELLSNDTCFTTPYTCANPGLTVSFWFKSAEQQDSDTRGRVFFKTGTVDHHTGFYMLQGDIPGHIIFQYRNLEEKCWQDVHVEPNIWSLLTFTFQQQEKLRVFINGENKSPNVQCTSSTSQQNNNGKFVLGNSGNLCSAQYDDLAIWYRKLTEEEIRRIYNYYYKDPPRLAAVFQADFLNITWNDDFEDKESQQFIKVNDMVSVRLGSLFPKYQKMSFISVENCRNESSVVCDIKLDLNASDYESIELLEEEQVIENVSLSNFVTENVPYEGPIVTNASSSEASTLRLEWKLNRTNLYQGFVIMYTNNKTNETFNVTEDKFQSIYELVNLTGFSFYEIKVRAYTLAGLGKWSEPITALTAEDVPKFAPGNLTGGNVSSTELVFQWDAVAEEETYHSVRGYVVYVTETDNPSVILKNITTNASTLFLNIDNLRKFTTYTLYIKAYTVDVGIKSMTLNLSTAEDVPDAPPVNLTAFNSSSTSIHIEFKPVPRHLINGILRGYRVFYFKTREGNHTRKNFTIEKISETHGKRRKRSADQYHDNYPLFADIAGLQAYTNYSIQIQAITIGAGVLAPPYTTLTGEDAPSIPPPNVTARNTSSTSILLEWGLMQEDDRNGVILGYVVYYNVSSGNETFFVHRSPLLSVEITGLQKFTIYGFELTAFTSAGESNRSLVVLCRTEEDQPSASPLNITGVPSSPVKMGIFWKPIHFPFRHGIILGYRFVFSTMSGSVLASRTLAPEKNLTFVKDLTVFTEYNVNMTAFTSKGDGPWVHKVILSLQLAPDIPPMNLSAQSHTTISTIPLWWVKVPPEKTKGYIIGYKVYFKLISIALEEVHDARENVVSLRGSNHSSYVLEGLERFGKYRIYVIAFTEGGDSPPSNEIYAETCRCLPILTTQWRNLAPYTNITNPESPNADTIKQTWGIFPYIINDAVQYCCKDCIAFNSSTVNYSRNEHGQSSESLSYHDLIHSLDGLTDLTFPVHGYSDMTMNYGQYKYTPLIESPGTAFIVRKDQSGLSGVLTSNLLGNWPLLLLIICFAFGAGAVIWILERRDNPEQFPPTVIEGIWNGFWWAYVSMTTVGYGDRYPVSIPGRIFAVIWTLIGLVITGIMVGDLASSLILSVTAVEQMIYGTKVAAIEHTPEFRLGLRLNAKMDLARSYHTLDELQKALLVGEVDGILLDGYVVGTRKDLFSNPKLEVNRIKDYQSAYGIVWAGGSSRMKVCLDWYMKNRKQIMFGHIKENLVVAKKVAKLDIHEEMQNLFDPTNDIFIKVNCLCLILIGIGVLFGLIYELIRRRRLARKIIPKRQNYWKEKRLHIETLQKFLQGSLAGLTDGIIDLKQKHMKQVKALVSRS